ncbi:SRPBCC family protein (plasmid) [Streptomyces sp. HUAS TT11]|uniref:SRPBCC family protein n=1 Tax=Streptomyces sp. HUAS TT11 TaxID=3447508 RepID=UPI003F65A7A3
MADTVASGNGKAKGGLSQLAQSEAVDHLKKELQSYLAAQGQRMLAGAGRKLGEATSKLTDIAEGNGPGLTKMALEGGRKLVEGKGPLRALMETGAGQAKEKIGEAVQSVTGGKSKRKGRAGSKPIVILESIDVGVPLRTAYDQWTQYQDFSTFAKGVKSASRADDTHSDWQAKVWWSNRSWKAQTNEQVPDDRISWTSEGAKGTTRGVVSFHSLAENLTRIELLIEYYPSGFFEKTGNIWRAQGRRTRLDLKNFVRFITLKGEAEDSWRGEIRDGEVVRTHEDAIAEEEEEPEGEYEEEEPEEEPEEEEPEGEYEEEEPEGEEPEGEYEEEELDEEEPEGEEDNEGNDEEEEEEYEEKPDERDAKRSPARSRR